MKLAIKYIQKYYKRSFAIALSIILSVVLIVGVGMLSQSVKKAEVDELKYTSGNTHLKIDDLDKEQMDVLNQSEEIKNISYTSFYDGYNYKDKALVNLIYSSENYLESDNASIIKGRFPKGEGEIALEEWVLMNLDLEPRLNQELELQLVNKGEVKKFKLVGIIEDRVPNKTNGIMEGIIGPVDTNKSNSFIGYIEFYEDIDILKAIDNIIYDAKIDIEKTSQNTMLLQAMGQMGRINFEVVGLVVLITLISATVIYSIFNISILQRISEYGILRAIGASKNYILKLILQELIIISVISIPIGIGLGIFTAQSLSESFYKLFTDFDLEKVDIIIDNKIIMLSIIDILLIDIIIALKIKRSIGKITPIEAIYKSKSEKVKNDKYRLIGVESLVKVVPFHIALAFKNMSRNKKGFIMIMISMVFGGILFIESTFYGDIKKQMSEESIKNEKLYYDYNVSINGTLDMSLGLSKKDIEALNELDGVNEVIPYNTLYGRVKIQKNLLNENFIRYLEYKNEEHEYNTSIKSKGESSIIQSTIWGFEDKYLEELDSKLLEGNIDLHNMKNTPICIVVVPYKQNQSMVDIKVGDKIKMEFRKDGKMSKEFYAMRDEGEYIEQELTVGGIITQSEFPTLEYWYTVGDGGVDLVLSNDMLSEISGFNNYRLININKEDDINSDELAKDIIDVTNRVNGFTMLDLGDIRDSKMAYSDTKNTFIYAISSVLFLTGVLNIVNNVSYSLISRTNEFGMIRAIGLTDKEFKEMIMFEGLFYGIISSIITVIVGFLIQYGLYKYFSALLESHDFNFDIKIYIAIVFANILVGLIATYFPARKIKNMTIVESIDSIE